MPGKKKGKKAKAEKIPLPNRSYYEKIIVELNQKLSRLRSRYLSMDGAKLELLDKLEQLEIDRTDVSAHLERTLAKRNETVMGLEEQYNALARKCADEKHEAEEKLQEVELRYKTTHSQLISEVKLLLKKYQSLDEFRLERDALLAQFDRQGMNVKEKDKTYSEDLFNMQQKAVVEKDALTKEVQVRLEQISLDFTRSSKIRNAGYTRRLIRENIALQNNIDALVESQIKLQLQYNHHMERFKEMAEEHTSLDRVKNELIQNTENKLEIIYRLSNNYEYLKEKFVKTNKYRTEYRKIIEGEHCDYFKFSDAKKRINELKKRIDSLNKEKINLLSVHRMYQTEIQKLRDIIRQIKSAVEDSLREVRFTLDADQIEESVDAIENALIVQELKRKDLLTELVNIISSHSDQLPPTPPAKTLSRPFTAPLYRPGILGLLHFKHSSAIQVLKIPPLENNNSSDSLQVSWTDTISAHEVASIYRGGSRFISSTETSDADWGTDIFASSLDEEETTESEAIEEEPLELLELTNESSEMVPSEEEEELETKDSSNEIVPKLRFSEYVQQCQQMATTKMKCGQPTESDEIVADETEEEGQLEIIVF